MARRLSEYGETNRLLSGCACGQLDDADVGNIMTCSNCVHFNQAEFDASAKEITAWDLEHHAIQDGEGSQYEVSADRSGRSSDDIDGGEPDVNHIVGNTQAHEVNNQYDTFDFTALYQQQRNT